MKIILTGATGYVGEGVMLELLRTPQVEKVLSVGRRSVRIDEYPLTEAEKAKLEEYIIPDFMDLKAGNKHFEGYDAVYFIAGITSIGTPEDVYRRISYDIPTHFADIMPSKEQMTYIYLSGAGTDPNGKQWWMPIFQARFCLPPGTDALGKRSARYQDAEDAVRLYLFLSADASLRSC